MAPNAWDGVKNILPADILYALSNNHPLKTGTLQSAKSLREHPAALASARARRLVAIEAAMATLNEEQERLSDDDYTRTAIDEVYAALCAPIRKVPADIIREIARYAMDDFPSPAGNRAPVNLAQVSSTWRSIILDSPQYWTTLYLRVRTADLDHLMQRLDLANAWFQRAGTLPINLFLFVDCKLGIDNNAAYKFSQFFKALGRWAPRIKRFGLGGRHWVNLILHCLDVEWNLSGLETLDILGGHNQDTINRLEDWMGVLQLHTARIKLFQNSPKLTSVILSLEMNHFFQSFRFIPWHQVTSFFLKEQAVGALDFENILTHCPKLVSASFNWDNLLCSDVLRLTPRDVGHLEKLYLDVSRCDYLALPHLFNRLSFPRLTHLFLRKWRVGPHDGAPADFQIRPLPALTHLTLLGDPNIPVAFLLQFLHKAPQLRTLVMEFPNNQDCPPPDINKICEAMTRHEDDANDFLPMLEECIFGRKAPKLYLLDASIISRFIHSRSGRIGAVSLKKVAFMGSFGFMSNLREEVAELSRAAGTEPSVEIIQLPAILKGFTGMRWTNLNTSAFALNPNYTGPRYDTLLDDNKP